MFGSLLILLTFIALLVSYREAGLLPFPTALIFFLALSQIMLLLVYTGNVYYGMHDLYDYGGLQANYTAVQFIYTSTAAIALTTLVGKYKNLKSANLSVNLPLLLSAKSKSQFQSSILMVCLCGIHLLLFLLLSDWEKLWLHQEYLESYTDPGWARLLGEEFTETVVRTTPLWAILSALCVCRLIGTRNTFLKIIASAMSIIYFLLLLSLHSRAAVFVPALLAINYIVLGLKRRRFMAAIMLFIATLALMGALEGRTTDQHGLSTIPETILNPFVSLDPVGAISQTLMDFCQGVVVTAESLQLPDDFDLKYKILVFSPFPSVIDGYSSIREQSEHRLHGFVPMSGVGELLHFGWVYTCVLLIGLTALIRAHTKIVQKRPAVFLICNFLIMLSIYLLFSYPVRNALRYYWIAVALFVAVDFARRWFPAVDSARRNGEEFDRAQSKPVQPKFLFHPRK